MRRTIIFIFILLAAASFNGYAQETTSEIQGMVTDASHSPLAGATVIAFHTPTGTRYATTTRKDGRFNLANLRIGGPYTITVSFVSFKEEKQENVFLLLGQEFKADFSLQSDEKQLTEVVVSAGRQNKIFNSGHTGSQEIINRTQIERLPTINRSLQDFTKLTPSSNGLSFGGRNSLYNNVTVDGANFNNAFGLASTLGGQTNSQPISLDAIEQIQVNVSPFDVRQGGFSGAGINSVTRSGTNQFKGSVYTYIKTPGFQGYRVKTVKLPQQDFNYNLRGASLGGPIIANKLFFFVSVEQERVKQPATSFTASDASHQPNGTSISQANKDTLDALRGFLVSTYQYDPGEFQGYSYRTQSDKLTAKIDWNVNEKNTLTFKYNYFKSLRDLPASSSGSPVNGRSGSATGLGFKGNGYTINNNFNIYILELNTRFNNRTSNKFQAGYTALRDFRASLAGKDFPLVDIMNGQGQTYTSFGYEPFTYNNLLNTDIYQLSDIFTKYLGKHELTIGTQNYYKKFQNGFAPNYEGNYRFNTLTDFYNSAKNGAATAVLYNLQYSAMKDGSFPYARIGEYEVGVFVQDKWRVRPNLTITYGLRVDAPIFENKFDYNPNIPPLTFRNGQHYDVGQKPGTNLLISPRAGFNWDVFNDQRTQIRGGVGLFAGPPPFVWISNQASNNGVQFGSFVKGPQGNPPTAPVVFSADPNAYRQGGAANTSYNLVFTDKNFKYPRVLKASLAIDQKLPGDIIATLEGTYSKDVNAVNFENVNLPDNSTGTPFAGSDSRVRYSSRQIYSGQGGATASNPNISNAILMTNYSRGYAYTVTLQVQKTFRNLYLNAAYTYSDARSMNDGGSIAASMWRDRAVTGDPNAPELGYASFYQPHRVIASASYRFEYAKHFATSIGLIFEAAPSNAAFPGAPPSGVGSYTYNGDVNNDGSGGNNDLMYIPKDKNDIVLVPVNTGGGPVTDKRTSDQIWAQLNNYINQDAYLSKHRGEYAQRNAVVYPFFKRLDMNITQDFSVRTGKDSRHTLRVSLDIINLGNLINRNWGIYKLPNSLSILKYEGMVSSTDMHPRYSFPYLDPANQIPLTSTFRDDTSPASRWQGQIGVRYLFN